MPPRVSPTSLVDARAVAGRGVTPAVAVAEAVARCSKRSARPAVTQHEFRSSLAAIVRSTVTTASDLSLVLAREAEVATAGRPNWAGGNP